MIKRKERLIALSAMIDIECPKCKNAYIIMVRDKKTLEKLGAKCSSKNCGWSDINYKQN